MSLAQLKIDRFLEAYEQAMQLLQPKGLDAVDLPGSSEIARNMAFADGRRRR